MSEPHPHLDKFDTEIRKLIAIWLPDLSIEKHRQLCEAIEEIADDCYISHSAAGDAEQRIRDVPKFTSEDLILLAHDEWKRREERKHLHNEGDWIAGFLNGFCTSRKWAREMVDKIRKDGKAIALLRGKE